LEIFTGGLRDCPECHSLQNSDILLATE